MSSKLAEDMARLQQAPDYSEQLKRLDAMFAVGYDNYWKNRQPEVDSLANFRGIQPLPQQPVQTQPMPDLTQPLLEPTTQEKAPEGRSGNNPLEVAKAFGKGVANFDEGNEQFTAGLVYAVNDFREKRMMDKVHEMAMRDELSDAARKEWVAGRRLAVVKEAARRAGAPANPHGEGRFMWTDEEKAEQQRKDEAAEAKFHSFNESIDARWTKFVEAAERGEIKLTDADKDGRSVDPKKLYADFKRFERGDYQPVEGYRPKAGEMKLGDNEWAQEVGLARSNDRMAGWYGDAESRKNKNTYERGTAAYYMMMAGESAPDLALTFGSTGLARGILKGAVKKAVVREGIGAAAKEAAEQTARAAGRTAAEVAAAGKAAEKMAVRGVVAERMATGKLAEAGAGAGMGFVSARVGFDAYASARAQGLPPQQAATYATWYALAEAIPERIAIGKILRGNGTVKKQVLRGMFVEGVQETITQALQQGADMGILGKDMTLREYLLGLADAGIVGTIMGGTVGGIHAGIQKAGEMEQANYREEWEALVGAGVDAMRGGGMGGGISPNGTPPAPGGNPAQGNPTHPGGTPPVNPNPAPQGQGAAPPQAGFGTVAAENGAPDVTNDELQEDLNELAGVTPPSWFDGKNWFSPAEIAAIAQTDLEAALRISSAQRVMANPDITDEQKKNSGVANIDSPAQVLEAMRAALGDNIIQQGEAAAPDNVTAEPATAQQQGTPQTAAQNADNAAANPAPVNNAAVNPAPVADSTAPQANPDGQARNSAPDSAQPSQQDATADAETRNAYNTWGERMQQSFVQDLREQARQLQTSEFDARLDALAQHYDQAAVEQVGRDIVSYARRNGYQQQRRATGGFDWVNPNQPTTAPQPAQNPAPTNPAPNTQPTHPAPVGGNSSTIRANGQEHGVTFEVREAASLTPTTEAGTANQARNRASNAQSAAQVANIAANLDPVTLTADTHEMDTGMPTLARDGQTIIAGNGRTMAVQQAYAQHPERAQAYRQHLIDNAAAYGIDPAAIAQMQNPVLVRRFTGDVDVQQMATASNAGTGMSLSAYELAATDAQALPADLRNLVGGTDGMIDPATGTNAAVMGQWAQALPENRRNAVYTQDGRTLSREGLLAFRNAVLYRAYGEGVDMGDGIISRQTLADIIENSVEELRNVRNALVNIAPRVVDMKARVQQGLYPAELDISADLLRASESLTQTRKANGPTVESIINQQNLDGSSYPANAATLLRYFNAHIRSGADIRSYLNGYYDWANAQQSTNTADIFGAAPPTAAQGLAEAARAVNEGRQLGAAGQANIHYSTPPQAGGFGISIPAGWPQDEHAEFAHPSLYEQYRRQFGDDIVARLAHLQNLSTNPALPDETRVDALREQTAILNYFRTGGTRPDIPANPYAPPRKAPPPVNQATQQVATRNGTQHSNDNETLPPPQQRALPPGSQALPPGQTQTNTAQEAAAQEQTAAPDYTEVRRLLERILGKRLAEKVTLSNTLPDGQPMPQEGAYLADGTLIINPDAIRAFEVDGVTVLTREQRIAWVAWHEFVHRGADYYRQVWGGKEWQTTLTKLRQNSALRHLAEAIQAERNAAYLNSGQDVRVTPEQAMEEALAELAAAIQQGSADALIARYGRFAPTTGRTKLQALLGKMADVIRRVLGRITKRQITQEELSDADAIGLLRDITALQGADDLADAQRMAGVTARQTPPAQAAEQAVQRQERMAPVDAAAYSTVPQTVVQAAKDKIRNFIQGFREKRGGKPFVDYMEVNDDAVAEARAQGLNIAGYKHVLDESAVKHVDKRHGEKGVETTRGQEAIRDGDFESIAEVVSTPDKRIYGFKTKDGNDVIASVKILADGTMAVVEEIRTRRRKLAVKTMRKHTAATDLDRVIETMLSNARSDGGHANIHVVDITGKITPQSATPQGERYSTAPSLDEAADSAFARAVDDVVAGKVSAGYISLGTTPEVLKLIGVPDGKVRISGGTIEKAMAGYLNRNNSYDENRHAIRPEDMKQLPAHLNAPIAVFKSATRADSFVVLTELMELENGRNKPVIAALHLQKGKRGLNLVDIASVYGRSDGQLVRAFDTDLLYLDKQKGRQFLTTHPLQLHWDITSDADLSARNIKTNEDLTQEADEAQAADNSGVVHHSTAPQAYTRDLMATHNISAAGILHADKLGGLPWASFAVTRANQPLTGFGEVTLIGDSDLADPKGRKKAKVFGADIYSPRQPRPVYKIRRDAIDEMWAPFARLAARFKEDTRRDLDSYANDTDAVHADDIKHTLSRSPAVRYTFLEQRGEQPPLHELDGTAREIEEQLRQIMEENGAANDFNDYVDDLWESLGGEPRLFKGYTDMGNRRFGRYDLAGIAAVMKRNLRGGESGSYGTGQVRAHVTPQFKTLKAIRSGKARLTDGETFRRLRDEMNAESAEIGDALGIYNETDFLQQVATDGWAAAVEGRETLDTPQNRRMVEDFLAKLADMPTEYFEGKLPGITRFSDFTAAVVPHDLGARAREVLENVGLRLFSYSDGESRSRAIEEAARVLDEERGGDILFSTTPEQQQTLRVARNRILNIARAIQSGGKYISGEPIDFGITPPVYQALGAEALPLKILNPRKLFSLLRPKSEQGQRGDNTHELTPELLAQIPQALQEPSLVFDSGQPDALVAVTSLQDSKGNPVVAAIHLSREAGFIRINKIASIYGKDNAGSVFNRWQKEGKLRYVDTKNPSLLTSDGVQFSQEKSAKEPGHTVLTEADVVKLQQQLTQTEAETRTGQALLGTNQNGEKFSTPPQLVTDPPTQAGLGKRIWQAFTDPTVRDLWFDRQGELERILKADPNAGKVRNAFKMYNARVQHVLEGVPQTMIQDLGKALAAHYREAERRIPALKNMKANKKVREQMFMEWLDGVGKYIYHGRERNAVILQRSKGKQTDGSGTDEAGIQEAERFFNSAEMGSGVLLTMYEDLYKHHLQPMMQMSDGYLRDAGLLTPEMEAARPNYRWYVPLFGAPQMEDSTIEKIVKDAAAAQRPNNGGASRTDVIRNRTHNAEGRHGTEAHNLFENIIAQMETAVRRAELQEPKRKLWAYLQTAEGARLFNATTSEYTINGGNRNTKGGRSWQKHTPDADEVVWQDGDTIHRMHIGNLRALEAIRDFNRQAFKYGANPLIDAGSWGLEQAGRVTRFMAGMYTRYNPSFVLRNKAMDSIQQWITLLADAPIGKETRAGLAGYADAIGNIASRLPVAAKAAAYNAAWTASGIWGRKGTDFAPWLERFARQGGVTTYSQYFGRDKLQSLQDIMWAETQGAKKWASLKHDFAALESMMTAINDHMELTTRVSAFRALVESGVSEEVAAVWAKDVMNFETKGDAGIRANALFPFFTTSLYDARRTFKALSKKEGQILFAALTGGFLALWQMLAAAGGEDDDGVYWVDKYPMSIAGRYAILPIPSDDGTMRGEGIRIPLGFGIARLANTLAVSTRRFTNGTDDGGRFASNLLNHGIISGFSPLQPSDVDISKDPAAWLVNTASPQVVKPIIQLAMNKNYRGAPIYDDGSYRGPGELDYNSGYESTPDTYKHIVKALYDGTGGRVDIAPETIQFLWNSALGGAGQDVVNVVETVLDQTGLGNKSTASWYKSAPVLGGFIQSLPSVDRERYQQNKENTAHRYNQLVDAAQRGKDHGKYQDAAYWHEYYKATEKQIRKLRKARKELKNSERLQGTDALRQQLRAIDGQILDIQKQANRAYKEWEKKNESTADHP